jgi:peptidoglycan/LPS O-acetylase OafA/YrhL
MLDIKATTRRLTMAVAQSQSAARTGRKIIAAVVVASILCLIAIAITAFAPDQARYEKTVYRVGEPIASFTINAFVARYHQGSEPFDRNKHVGVAAAGYTVVNTVQWTAWPRRAAVLPTVLALLVIVSALRKRPPELSADGGPTER